MFLFAYILICLIRDGTWSSWLTRSVVFCSTNLDNTQKKKALRCHWSSLSFFCFYFIFSCLFVVYFINSKRFSLFFFRFVSIREYQFFVVCVCIPAECVRENTRASRVGGGGRVHKNKLRNLFFFLCARKKKGGGISFVVAVSFFFLRCGFVVVVHSCVRSFFHDKRKRNDCNSPLCCSSSL